MGGGAERIRIILIGMDALGRERCGLFMGIAGHLVIPRYFIRIYD